MQSFYGGYDFPIGNFVTFLNKTVNYVSLIFYHAVEQSYFYISSDS